MAGRAPMIEGISAVTLVTRDMARAVTFYRRLGFEVVHGGEDAAFTSFRADESASSTCSIRMATN